MDEDDGEQFEDLVSTNAAAPDEPKLVEESKEREPAREDQAEESDDGFDIL